MIFEEVGAVCVIVEELLGHGMSQCAYSPYMLEICSGEFYKFKVVEKTGEISLYSNPSYPYG